MKFNIFIFLLVANTVFSLRAVTIINNTLGIMWISGFGYQGEDGDFIAQQMPAELSFCGTLRTEERWGKSYHFATVTLYGKLYFFRDLKPETLITFKDGNNYDVIYKRSDSPELSQKTHRLVVYNHTTTTIFLSNFEGELINFVERHQLQAAPVVLAPDDGIELGSSGHKIERMYVSGNDYRLTAGIFENLNEYGLFPSGIFPALSNAKTLIFYMENGTIAHKKSSKNLPLPKKKVKNHCILF